MFNITEEQSKRLNIMKMLLCIFVVCIHSANVFTSEMSDAGNLYRMFINGIFRCCNDGFFLISAILLYRKPFSFRENIKKKIRTLVFPYLIANVLQIVMLLIFAFVPFTRQFLAEEDYVCKWNIVQ